MRTLVVLATHNEIHRVEEALRATRECLPDADILVVDDRSSDGTAERAEKLAGTLERVEVLRRPAAGRAGAQRAGLRIGLAKGYELVATTDPLLAPDYRAFSAGFLRRASIDDLPLDGVAGGRTRRWWARRHRRG